MMKKGFWIFLFVLLGLQAEAQIKAMAELDSTTVQVGDQFYIHLQVDYAKDSELGSIDFSAYDSLTAIEVIDKLPGKTSTEGNTNTFKQDIKLQAWDTGHVFLPAIVVNYENTVSATNDLLLTIENFETDSIALADIRPIRTEPLAMEDWLPYAAAIFAFFLLAFGVYYFTRQSQQKRTANVTPKRILTPKEWALAALQALEKEELWQKGKVKDYYSSLTDIVRTFLEREYEFPALEMTSFEILNHIRKIPNFQLKWSDAIAKTLQGADLVKFAKADPIDDFHKASMQRAIDIIEQTAKPKPSEEEAPNE